MSVRLVLVTLLTLAAAGWCGADWDIRRDNSDKTRPPITDGVVDVCVGDDPFRFPQYLNELGINKIRIRFTDAEGGEKKLSFVWSGGSLGVDKFAVSVDGIKLGNSQMVDSPKRPYAWYRDSFHCELASGADHVIEITQVQGFTTAIEFERIRLSSPGSVD